MLAAHHDAVRDLNARARQRMLDAGKLTGPRCSSASEERRAFCRKVLVPTLAAEGDLHRSWKRAEASAYLAQMTSFRLWDDLVNLEQLRPSRYEALMTASLSERSSCTL